MFMRLNNSPSPMRLVALDDATSSLKSSDEREILDQFLEQREGKTVIFVASRFTHLAKHADLIL